MGLKTTPRRVAIYARVSTKAQDARPQLARLREWALREGFTVGMDRTDLASGRLVRRPGAEAIMQEARGHHVHAVAVAKVDRWARSLQHLSATVNELHALGVDFYAVDQGLTVRKDDPTAKLMLHILAACAEWEASIISERTKDGLQGKVGRGRHRRGCGVEFACPTGVHGKVKKGMRNRTLARPLD
jgi:DNA invertase Pin-like site-specific DNA recombinase